MRIAVLCRYPEKLATALQFLRKREISVVAFDNLPDFLAEMRTGISDVMLTSLSFQHPKADKLPFLAEQMFHVPAIVFTESGDAGIQMAMQKGDYKYKIPDQISGPAIEMAVNRALREIANAGKPDSTTKRAVVSGEADDKHIIVMSGQKNQGAGGFYMDKGESALSGNELKIAADLLLDNGTDSSSAQKDAHRALQSGQASTANSRSPFGGTKAPGFKTRSRAFAPNERPARIPQDLSMDSVSLWVCALNAIKSASGDQAQSVESVADPSNCVMLNLRTPKAQGTFVIAIGQCNVRPEAIIDTIIEDLFGQMKEYGFGRPKPEEFDIIEAENGLIQDEVLERARFHAARESVLGRIAITYVDHAKMLSYVDFDDDDLKEVPLASIEPGTILDFPLLIKMIVTRRFLGYVNVQCRLSAAQSVRLTGYGIRNFYVPVADYDRYLLHVARQDLQAELKKRGLRLVKKAK